MPVVFLRCLPILIALLMPSLPATGADTEDADVRLFKAQQTMAEKGNARAQYYLGEMHEHGLGTREDMNEALKWYAKAAEQGDPLARRKLAHMQEPTGATKKEQPAGGRSEPPQTAATPAMPAATRAETAGQAPQKPAQEAKRTREEERIKAEEREKRRAIVRSMILERMRNPVGDPFE